MTNEDEDPNIWDADVGFESFGVLKASVKLGAFTPEWSRVQSAKLEAELEKHYGNDGGIFAGIRETHDTNEIVASNLRKKRNSLREKLQLAREIRDAVPDDNLAAKQLAELGIIALRGELVEIETHLATLRAAQRKLRMT